MNDNPLIDAPPRGYFGIGIFHGKTETNLGTLWRGAYRLGASFIFTVGCRYRRQASDTVKTWLTVPLFQYETVGQLADALYDCPLVAVECGGRPLTGFSHPPRAAYLLGAEDHGLPDDVLARCHAVVTIPAVRMGVYNVAQAGTVVMYDRMVNGERGQA